MAVVNTKSTNVSNADATPKKRTKALLTGGRLREIVETVEIAAGDDDASTFRLCRLWSGWRISSIVIRHDAITGGTSYDFGLYENAENGAALIDVDAYASAVDISAAQLAGQEIAFEARDVSKVKDQVWQDAGKAADTDRWYDLVALANTVGTAAGTLSVTVHYTDGS